MRNELSPPLSGPAESSPRDRLDSWKEIAYLKREVRTVQRWEKSASPKKWQLLTSARHISSRDAFPCPRSIFCFIRFHRELFRFVPPHPFWSVRDDKEHFRMDFPRFQIVLVDCDCSPTRNRHFVPGRQDIDMGLREIDRCWLHKISVSQRRHVNARDFASGVHIVNRQPAFVVQTEHGSRVVRL